MACLITLAETVLSRMRGTEGSYWRQVIDFDALVRYGTIGPDDVGLVFRTDSVDEAYDWLVRRLREDALDQPGAML